MVEYGNSLTGPATDAATVTPADTDLPRNAKSLYVVVGGTLTIQTIKGTTLSLGTVQAATIIPIQVKQVRTTGTTATVVALFE